MAIIWDEIASHQQVAFSPIGCHLSLLQLLPVILISTGLQAGVLELACVVSRFQRLI